MRKMTATAGDIIKALSKVPTDTPVFGYSYTDECDLLLEIMEICPGPVVVEEEDKEWAAETGQYYHKYSPKYCKGDSYVEEHWRENGEGPVVFLRESSWCDTENDTVINIKED